MGIFKSKKERFVESFNELTPKEQKLVRNTLKECVDGLTPEQIEDIYRAALRAEERRQKEKAGEPTEDTTDTEDTDTVEDPATADTTEEAVEEATEEIAEVEAKAEAEAETPKATVEPSPLEDMANKIEAMEKHLYELIKNADQSFGIGPGFGTESKDPKNMTFGELKAYLMRTGDIR